MENRRQRYSPGSPIKNQNIVIDVKFDITEIDLMCAYIISENRKGRGEIPSFVFLNIFWRIRLQSSHLINAVLSVLLYPAWV